MLQILDIKKSFGELHVLRGVDLDVEQGDVVAIIGPSGSGKTTLLRCINFLEKADSGTLIFDNEKFEFDKITKKEIARLAPQNGVRVPKLQSVFEQNSAAERHRGSHRRPQNAQGESR